MALDAEEKNMKTIQASLLLVKQQEAELRLQEPSTNDQMFQVRTSARRSGIIRARSFLVADSNCLSGKQANVSLRRRSHRNKIMISKYDLFPMAEKATDSAIGGRETSTDNEPHRHRCQRHTRRSSSSLSSYLLLYPSSLLLSVSFTFAIITLVNLGLQSSQFVAASSSGPAGLASTTAQQQSNSVIQMPSTTMSATPQGSIGSSSSSSMLPSGKARYRTMYACEDRLLTMDCDPGSKINLIRANFGRFSITQCNEQGQLDLSIDCMSPITFRIMQDRCRDKQKCSVNATSVIFGDYCQKTRKYLEVHFQCQPDPRVLSLATDVPDRVDLRNTSQLAAAAAGGILAPGLSQATQSVVPTHSATSPLSQQQSTSSQAFISQSSAASSSSSILPPNNNLSMVRQQQQMPSMAPPLFQPHQQDDFNRPLIQQQQHQPMTVMNSEIMSYNHASNTEIALNKLQDPSNNREPIVVTMRHTHVDNMSNPRCVLWDQAANQWTERGSQIIETNLTHTICAFDQVTSYLLVMDYMAPTSAAASQSSSPTISNFNQINQQQKQQPSVVTQTSVPQFGSPIPDILENQPVVLDQQTPTRHQSTSLSSINSTNNKFFSFFSYLLVMLFVAIAFMTIAFVASSLRNSSSSAGAAFKSLGNFAAMSGSNGALKYKHRRQDVMSGTGPGSTLHSGNKDLLIINNSNGHQFLYAPASTTKISSSSSTHILSAAIGGHGTTNGQPTHQQGTLHRVQQQQQQMYSGNGATLSSLSAAGTQSNNYYYGLMGLSPLFQQQQQQQQQRFNQQQQHHANQQQSQQISSAQGYNHQANKSTISTESANSSSSSGVESGSTSMQQQQQQAQQACLVTTSNVGNEFNLMNGQLTGYGQAQNLFLSQNGNNFQQHQPQPTLTMNAHYSASGVVQPINNMGAQMHHQRQLSNQMRDHIYETVEYEKPYMSRLLLPLNNSTEQQQQQQQQHNQFGTIGHHHQLFQQQQQADHHQMQQQQRTMTLSSRMLHDTLQNQQQQQSSGINKRSPAHFPQPAIVRDHQPAKTNIICSKLAQVTPQRATEIGKTLFSGHDAHHDIMTIYNGNDASTTTTTTSAAATSTTNSCYDQRLELNNSNSNKLSTDC